MLGTNIDLTSSGRVPSTSNSTDKLNTEHYNRCMLSAPTKSQSALTERRVKLSHTCHKRTRSN